MRYVFSMLLAYWSWLKQETFWECGDHKAQKRAEWAIRKMLSELIQLWPREAGHGWFKPKIHEQLHVPGDISHNGSPRNTYTGPVENNHLNVKAQARRTQMNRELLDSQIGTRSAEAYIVNYGHDRVCNQDQLPLAPDTSETHADAAPNHRLVGCRLRTPGVTGLCRNSSGPLLHLESQFFNLYRNSVQ
jgi:hypothetical protein